MKNTKAKMSKRVAHEISRLSPSLVYSFLRQLEQRGLIDHTIKHVGEKEKKVYELTAEGKELCEHLFKRFAALISVVIEPSLEICANCGCKVYEGRYREMIDGKETVFCCEHCAGAYKQERVSRG